MRPTGNNLSAHGGTDCPKIDRPTLLFHSRPKIIPILVTNDLYRKCRKVQARSMHNGFPKHWFTAGLLGCSKPAAKSLFRNILPVSPCGSIFWQDQAVSLPPKSLEINNLEERAKKNEWSIHRRERAEQQS
jgi:hypothetical protein